MVLGDGKGSNSESSSLSEIVLIFSSHSTISSPLSGAGDQRTCYDGGNTLIFLRDFGNAHKTLYIAWKMRPS